MQTGTALTLLFSFACLPLFAAAQNSAPGSGIGIGPVVSTPQTPVGMETAPIRVDVHLVNVFVNVTDGKGSPVGGLTQEELHSGREWPSGKDRDLRPRVGVAALDRAGDRHQRHRP